jgi:hypothetical protein
VALPRSKIDYEDDFSEGDEWEEGGTSVECGLNYSINRKLALVLIPNSHPRVRPRPRNRFLTVARPPILPQLRAQNRP